MNIHTHLNSNYKIYCVLMLLLTFVGCQTSQYDQQVNDLVREGNKLIEQEADLTSQWKAEYVKTFTLENRTKFPANRDNLRSLAENQIRLLEQSQNLLSRAIDKFEQASRISKNEKEKKFTSLTAESFRKDIEVNQLFREQVSLVLDTNINDLQTFEAKFKELTQKAEMKIKERDNLQAEAKRIIGK